MELEDYLSIAGVLVSLALIGIILIQVKGEGMGGLQSGSFVRTKRGLEKTLFQLTIALVVVFIATSIISVQQF